MTKYKQNFENCVSKIQKMQNADKFRGKITEIPRQQQQQQQQQQLYNNTLFHPIICIK